MSDVPVVIEVAINGLRTKRDNPNVPVSPAEIAADALACFDAGAAVVHNHIDQVGLPDADTAARYLEAWDIVFAERPDALLYPTVNADAAGHITYDHLAVLAEHPRVRIGQAGLIPPYPWAGRGVWHSTPSRSGRVVAEPVEAGHRFRAEPHLE